MAKKQSSDPQIVGAGIGSAVGAMLGVAMGGPVGPVIGAGVPVLVGHCVRGNFQRNSERSTW